MFSVRRFVGAQVVHPDRLRPRLLRAGPAVEEEHVGLDALGVEDARRQAQERVDLALLEPVPAHGLSGAALEEDVVGHDHCGAPVDLAQRFHVLEEVALLVRRRHPEVGAVVGEHLPIGVAFLVDDGNRRLLAEGRVRDHHVGVRARLIAERVVGSDRRLVAVGAVGADAVQVIPHKRATLGTSPESEKLPGPSYPTR